MTNEIEIRKGQPLDTRLGLETVGGFEALQRAAMAFANSTMAPRAYRGNIGDCIIAVDMALRLSVNPLTVMQNMFVINGRPSWSAQFLIATFNACGRFEPICYEFEGEQGKDSRGCRAVAKELATGRELVGPLVNIKMAREEGWLGRDGSKWKTMPELMLRYRAAAFLIRTFAPEIALCLYTQEEMEDMEPVKVTRVQAKAGPVEEASEKPVEVVEEASEKPIEVVKEKPGKRMTKAEKAKAAFLAMQEERKEEIKNTPEVFSDSQVTPYECEQECSQEIMMLEENVATDREKAAYRAGKMRGTNGSRYFMCRQKTLPGSGNPFSVTQDNCKRCEHEKECWA